MTTKEVKEFLLKVKKNEFLIQHKLREKEALKQRATSITSQIGTERVQSSGSKDRMADAVCESVDIGREIELDIITLERQRQEVIRVIDQLELEKYLLIYKVYVGELTPDGERVYMTLKEFADTNHNTYNWATNIHGTALKDIQNILEQKEKSGA